MWDVFREKVRFLPFDRATEMIDEIVPVIKVVDDDDDSLYRLNAVTASLYVCHVMILVICDCCVISNK